MKRLEAGFTLIELLIIIAIISIAATVGLLNLNRSTNTYVVETARERLIQELRSARAEAIARNSSVDFILVNQNTFRTQLLDNNGNVIAVIRRNFQLVEPNANIAIAFNQLPSRVVFDNKGRITNISSGNQASIGVIGDKTVTINLNNTGYIGR